MLLSPPRVNWVSFLQANKGACCEARAGFGKVSGLRRAGMRQLCHPGSELCMGLVEETGQPHGPMGAAAAGCAP